MSNKDYMESGLTLVNQTNIKNFKNKNVIVHGKIQSIRNNILYLLIDPMNNKELIINGFRKNIPSGEFIVIIGKVAADLSLDFVDFIQLDKDFDLDYVNEIIPISDHPDTKYFFGRN